MEIKEGRLEEHPCPDCDGVERRAFGEAVSSRGELASYAIGWTTGGDHESARMTVGIGAGNPAGGSFHIELLRSGDEWACASSTSRSRTCPRAGPTSRASRRSRTRT